MMTSNVNRDPNPTTTSSSNNSRTSLIYFIESSKPLGASLFGQCFRFNSQHNKWTFHKTLVLLLTFIAYTAFHMGRRPISVVKNVWNRNCTISPNYTLAHSNQDIYFDLPTLWSKQTHEESNSCSWAPFDVHATADRLLATLDSCFLLSYAIFMFISGIIAERMNLRYFISIGSILSGVGLVATGLAYPLGIHSMAYFVAIQIICGAVQSTGWPVVVTCMSNWFGSGESGLIYGFWNSHTSIGNIVGAVIAGLFVEYNWGLSFMVPGAIMIVVGIILFLFLVPSPCDVDLTPKSDSSTNQPPNEKEFYQAPNINGYDKSNEARTTNIVSRSTSEHKAVSFLTALRIPGVLEYSFCLFFSKLVSVTFLYWLPRYIKSSTAHSSENSAYLSVPFDVGGVTGGALAGYFSDKFEANGITNIVMLLGAVPAMFLYQQYGSLSNFNNIALQLIVGILVNGPLCLITTAVSADLGTRLKDGRAMATVAAIIDGMGSVGAVIGPFFAGFVSNSGNWTGVFVMLMLSEALASVCLSRIAIQEFRQKFSKTRSDPIVTI